MLSNPDRQFSKMIADNRSKFLLTHASSGFKHALKEVLADPGVAQALANTKVNSSTEEVKWWGVTVKSGSAEIL